VIDVQLTSIFRKWLDSLRDRKARARIQARIDRLTLGNFGDARSVGEGVGELRIDYGPGYRIYFLRRGNTAVILLCGGDKHTQAADIAWARKVAKEID
jgi:putative addiction module killer protein